MRVSYLGERLTVSGFCKFHQQTGDGHYLVKLRLLFASRNVGVDRLQPVVDRLRGTRGFEAHHRQHDLYLPRS